MNMPTYSTDLSPPDDDGPMVAARCAQATGLNHRCSWAAKLQDNPGEVDCPYLIPLDHWRDPCGTLICPESGIVIPASPERP
jgi:hypothetical protein